MHTNFEGPPTNLSRLFQGIHLNFNTFSMLNRLGNARRTIDQIGHSGTTQQRSRLQHINGKTLELVDEKDWSGELPFEPLCSCRVLRPSFSV